MNRLTRDGTAEPVSRDQILRHARGQGNVHFPCSADHEQDWQPYPVDPYSATGICYDHTYMVEARSVDDVNNTDTLTHCVNSFTVVRSSDSCRAIISCVCRRFSVALSIK